MSSKRAVVAIGGNSLIRDKQHQSVRDQYIAAGETCWHIAAMMKDGWDVVVGSRQRAAGRLHPAPLRARRPRAARGAAGRLRRRQPGRDRLRARPEPRKRLSALRARPACRRGGHPDGGRRRRSRVRVPVEADRLVHGRGDGEPAARRGRLGDPRGRRPRLAARGRLARAAADRRGGCDPEAGGERLRRHLGGRRRHPRRPRCRREPGGRCRGDRQGPRVLAARNGDRRRAAHDHDRGREGRARVRHARRAAGSTA